jgi:death-on-curing protein
VSQEPKWLTVEVIYEIHKATLNIHGGIIGVRDYGGLESALDRPVNQWHYGKAKRLPELAAAYLYGIARSHPFTDGNKRTALSAAVQFLHFNGHRFVDLPTSELASFIEGVAAGRHTESAVAEWIARHTVAEMGGTTSG